MVLGGLATSIWVLNGYLGRDSRFRIAGAGNIESTGLTEVSRTEMLPVFGEDIGRNVFFVPLSERRKQLEEIPWVERATVMRLLPDRIRVSVVERQPVAFVREGQQVGLVDASGVLLTMPAAMMAQHHYSFPVVTGIDPRDPPAGRKARMATYERLLTELDAGGQHLSEQISEIDLTDQEDARVLMPEQGADILAHFGEDHFLERYQRYKEHIAEWHQQYPNLAAVDLRYNQQVVLEMTHGSNAVQDAQSNQAGTNSQAAPGSGAGSGAGPAGSSDRNVASDKPSAAESAHLEGQSKPKPAARTVAESVKPAPASPASQLKKAGGAGTKGARGSSKPQTAQAKAATIKSLTAKDKAAKEKAAREKKKRAEAAERRAAAVNTSKHKPAPTHPAAVSAQGQ
jgi:cell division protein FtsQ